MGESITWTAEPMTIPERVLVRVFDGDREMTREVFGAEYGEEVPVAGGEHG